MKSFNLHIPTYKGEHKYLLENMTKHIQTCKSCGKDSEGELYHLGFSGMGCMYCDSCPSVLLLKDDGLPKRNGISWLILNPEDEGWMPYNRHLIPSYRKFESLFKSCPCGGRYRTWAVPRCMECNNFLFGYAPEQDNPVTWQNKRYVFITMGSVTDAEQIAKDVA
jgi:hypothetical protein